MIACYNNNMDNKDQEKAKKDIMIYQWLYIVPFSVIGGVGIIATAVVALFVFICSAKYVVASFMLDSGKIFPALVLTFIGLCYACVFHCTFDKKVYQVYQRIYQRKRRDSE